MSWPYPTVRVDGTATVDEEGENQVCACGNDSWTQDWRRADRLGRLAVECGQSHLERVCGTKSQDLAQVAIRRDAEALSV